MNYKKHIANAKALKAKKVATGKPQARKTMGQAQDTLIRTVTSLQITQQVICNHLEKKGLITPQEFQEGIQEVVRALNRAANPLVEPPATETDSMPPESLPISEPVAVPEEVTI